MCYGTELPSRRARAVRLIVMRLRLAWGEWFVVKERNSTYHNMDMVVSIDRGTPR